MSVKNIATPPSRVNFAREMLAGVDMLGLPKAFFQAPRKDSAPSRNYPVMVLPGFGAGDVSTLPMRHFLTRYGFETQGWGMGINRAGQGLIGSLEDLSERWDVDRSQDKVREAEVPALADKVAESVMAKAKEQDTKFHIVGWSLGGFIAREVARDLPDYIHSVVTMGSPVFGGPKYTSTAGLFRARKVDLDWIEDEIEKRFDNPIQQPITNIFSKRDGIVGWQAAKDHLSPNVNHVEVNISHLGLGLNAKVWKIMLDALVKHDSLQLSSTDKN
jgi:pimeloyl-ACP methyl ester carboxylesterase